MPNTSKIEISIPRENEKLVRDLLHLNGFPTTVDRPDDRPVVIQIFIEASQFEAQTAREASRQAVCS